MVNQIKEQLNNNDIFSKEEKYFFLKKIFKDRNPDSSFLYKWKWSELYDKILESDSYTINKNELKLLKEHKELILKYIQKNITDVGCWNGEKICILLKGNYVNNLKYIWSDYSPDMISLAEKNISEALPGIHFGNHQVVRSGNDLFTNNLDDNTYLCFWELLSNFSKEKTIEQLKNMNNRWILKGNNIIFTVFDAPKTEEEIGEVISNYDTKEAENFVLNWLNNLWIDTENFEYVVTYDKTKNCIYVWIEAKKDCEINTDNWDSVYIKKWQIYPVHQSKRFTKNEIKEILKKSGAKLEKIVSEDWISLVIAKKSPKYRKTFNSILWWTGFALLGVLWWMTWYNISQVKEQKAILERSKEFAKKGLKDKTIKIWYHTIFDEKTDINDKVNELEKGTNNTYNYLRQIFHYTGDEYAEKIIKSAIRSELRKADNLNLINKDIDQPWYYYTKFIREILIPNQYEILNNYLDIDNLYKDLKNHKIAFENSVIQDWDLSVWYNQYGNWTATNSNRVYVKDTSENIKTMLPWQHMNDNWQSYNILTSDWLKAEIIWSFFYSGFNRNVTVLKITITKDWKPFDILLFKDGEETSWYEEYRLDQTIAQSFLNTRWKESL